MEELGFTQKRDLLFCDSQSTIHLGKSQTFHARSKHIDMRYHWICNVLDDKLLELEKIHIEDNYSDILTKPLQKRKVRVLLIDH